MEEAPSFANIKFGEDTVPATRNNTVVYQHLDEGSLYDHVFIEHDSGEFGAYIWKNEPPHNPNYEPLLAAAVEHNVELHLNIQVPSEKDVKAFGKAACRELKKWDSVPEDWS